jgi:hypothetical protein
MSLRYLLGRSRTTIDDIADYLDALPPSHREAEACSLGLVDQARLYARAADAPALDLSFFVPGSAGSLQEVVHEGRNTFPVLRRFQKRFARPEGHVGRERLFGYNHGITLGTLGPGYFVACPTGGDPRWLPRGGVVIDYYQVPDDAVPAGWPTVIPNGQGLQRLVYNGTRDFMRRVSAHVSVGRAYKGEVPLPSYFVLCRTGE